MSQNFAKFNQGESEDLDDESKVDEFGEFGEKLRFFGDKISGGVEDQDLDNPDRGDSIVDYMMGKSRSKEPQKTSSQNIGFTQIPAQKIQNIYNNMNHAPKTNLVSITNIKDLKNEDYNIIASYKPMTDQQRQIEAVNISNLDRKNKTYLTSTSIPNGPNSDSTLKKVTTFGSLHLNPNNNLLVDNDRGSFDMLKKIDLQGLATDRHSDLGRLTNRADNGRLAPTGLSGRTKNEAAFIEMQDLNIRSDLGEYVGFSNMNYFKDESFSKKNDKNRIRNEKSRNQQQ